MDLAAFSLLLLGAGRAPPAHTPRGGLSYFRYLLLGAGRVPPAHTLRGGLSYFKYRRLSKRKREEKRGPLCTAGLAPQPSRLFVRAGHGRPPIRADRHASDSAGLALERRRALPAAAPTAERQAISQCRMISGADDSEWPAKRARTELRRVTQLQAPMMLF